MHQQVHCIWLPYARENSHSTYFCFQLRVLWFRLPSPPYSIFPVFLSKSVGGGGRRLRKFYGHFRIEHRTMTNRLLLASSNAKGKSEAKSLKHRLYLRESNNKIVLSIFISYFIHSFIYSLFSVRDECRWFFPFSALLLFIVIFRVLSFSFALCLNFKLTKSFPTILNQWQST